MNAPTLIWLSQAMTVSVLTCNKAAYKGRKNGVCVCVCVRACVGRGGRGVKATKLVTALHRAAYFTLIRPVSLADAELALC